MFAAMKATAGRTGPTSMVPGCELGGWSQAETRDGHGIDLIYWVVVVVMSEPDATALRWHFGGTYGQGCVGMSCGCCRPYRCCGRLTP